MGKITVAVVGCGHWGKNLIRNFSELGALNAIVDPDKTLAEKFSDQYGVPAATYDEVCANPDITGVVIAAPAELHAQLALQAFSAGKHVYVEKPIALTVEDGEAMKQAAEKQGKVLMVGHLLQYHPAFIKLRQVVEAGEIGKVRYAYSNRLSTGKFRVEENALWSLAPHDFSMLLSLFKEPPTEIVGRGGAYVTPGIEDEYHVDMTFLDGARAHVFASWLHPFKEQKLVVIGEEAMIVFEDSEPEKPQKLRIYKHKIDTTGPAPVPQKADVEYVPFDMDAEPLREECRHFLECCENNTRPRTDADEALAVLRALVAAS